MKDQIRTLCPSPLFLTVVGGVRVDAAIMSANPTPPPVTGLDIANYGTITGNDKWFAENSGAGAAKGQTFTTGSTSALLKSITYQVTASQKAEPTKPYTIRVGTISGSTFTQIHSETATQNFTWNGGEYMTWTFANPVLLAPNTLHGVDVGMTGSTTSWQAFTPASVTASGTTPVESVTIELPAGLLTNPGLFIRVAASSN